MHLLTALFALGSLVGGGTRAGATAAPQQRPAAAPNAYDGRAGQTRVSMPRLDGDVEIDGNLSEPQWQKAALLTGFSEFAPTDGVPAVDSTQVLVWYSATAMYVGVRAYEVHGPVHPNLADRDHIGAEDRIELLVSTFNDGRQAYDFQVNPLGIQADGTVVETGASQNTAGPNGNNTASIGRVSADLSADFVFQSKGRATPYGYEVEIRIPFKSIRYQAADVQDWGFNVVRHVQHSGHDETWTPARRAAASFLGQSGTLTGLTDLHRGLVLDFNPEITQTVTGAPRATGYGYTMDHTNVGANLRWGVTNNLTLNATAKPDFSQVEADAGQLTYDPRQALFFAERRPFFLDGIEQFTVPSNLIYTRQIVQPVAAGKLTGTVSGTNVALLTAADDPRTSLVGDAHPLFAIARVQRDLGSDSRVGALYTDREDGGDYNRVAGGDVRVVMHKLYTLRGQFAESQTHEFGESFSGPLWGASLDRNGRIFGFNYTLSGVSPDFVTRSGFVSRNGVANGTASHRLSYIGQQGAFLENFTGVVTVAGTWQYDHFMTHRTAQDKKLHFDLASTLRGGWGLGMGLYTETFGYDPALFANYRVVVPGATAGTLDTVAFSGRKRIPNHDWLFSFNTPQGAHFSANGFFLLGQDENFFEWEQAAVYFTNLTLNWRPTAQLRVTGTYARQQYDRTTENSTVAVNEIPYVKVEYQLSRPIFVRLVTEYDSQRHDALIDARNGNAPILYYDSSTGSYTPASSFRTGRFHVQGLFSYQPEPGTVFFAGYGALLDEPNGLRFNQYTRLNDGFFVKLSYLFRAR